MKLKEEDEVFGSSLPRTKTPNNRKEDDSSDHTCNSPRSVADFLPKEDDDGTPCTGSGDATETTCSSRSSRIPTVHMISAPGIAYPETSYSQRQVGELLDIQDKTTWKLLNSPHIQKRHLYLPLNPVTKGRRQPTASERHMAFQRGLEDMGLRAISSCLASTDHSIRPDQIDILTTVTSTAMPMPGVSAIIARKLGSFRDDIQRMDLVGMGCNGGMSGLRALSTTLGQLASIRGTTTYGMLFCCEVNSAFFINRDTTGDGIVNSLFGDGSVALLLSATPPSSGSASCFSFPPSKPLYCKLPPTCVTPHGNNQAQPLPKVSLLDFESYTVPEYFEDMQYLVDEDSQLMYFQLSKRIPHAVGSAVHIPVKKVLARNGMAPRQVNHWVVHGGGKRVMELVAESLGLDCTWDLRHTHSIMRDFGNLSSCSFLFSYARLLEEHFRNLYPNEVVLQPGQRIIFVAMGPGATIEVAMAEVDA